MRSESARWRLADLVSCLLSDFLRQQQQQQHEVPQRYRALTSSTV